MYSISLVGSIVVTHLAYPFNDIVTLPSADNKKTGFPLAFSLSLFCKTQLNSVLPFIAKNSAQWHGWS